MLIYLNVMGIERSRPVLLQNHQCLTQGAVTAHQSCDASDPADSALLRPVSLKIAANINPCWPKQRIMRILYIITFSSNIKRSKYFMG